MKTVFMQTTVLIWIIFHPVLVDVLTWYLICKEYKFKKRQFEKIDHDFWIYPDK